MSMESRYCSRISLGSTASVSWRMRSPSVDLPWSMWAMMAMLRSCSMRWRAGALERVTFLPFSPLVAAYGIAPPQEGLAGGEAAHVLGDQPGEGPPRHLRGVGAVGRDDAVRQIPEGMAVGQGLGIGDVEGGAADAAGSQGVDEIVGDDMTAPCHIHQPGV